MCKPTLFISNMSAWICFIRFNRLKRSLLCVCVCLCVYSLYSVCVRCMYVCVWAGGCMWMHVCMYMCVHVCVCVRACVRACVCGIPECVCGGILSLTALCASSYWTVSLLYVLHLTGLSHCCAIR